VTSIAVGAYLDKDAGLQAGAVYILNLDADSWVIGAQKITSLTGGFGNFYSLSSATMFGSSVCATDDLNNDGVQDLLVGAKGFSDGTSMSGAMFILYLNRSGYVIDAYKISNSDGGLSNFYTLSSNAYFGSAMASLGRVKNDAATVEVMVGAPTNTYVGVTHLLSLFAVAPTLSPTVSNLPTTSPTITLSPTSLPSSLPTSLPSFLPTPHPTSSPTPTPTISPTMVPTADCSSGYYYNADSNVCTKCPVGQYSDVDKPPYATSCTLCEIGRYASLYGSSECDSCSSGKYSSVDRRCVS
jgi:hypothetical protein